MFIPEPHEFDLFEWDGRKAASNATKHGIAFADATGVFLDDDRHVFPDERRDYREPRFNVVGLLDGVLVTVTYTVRGDCCRIISARPASRRERRLYENGQTGS